jgi:hypothetical protein
MNLMCLFLIIDIGSGLDSGDCIASLLASSSHALCLHVSIAPKCVWYC